MSSSTPINNIQLFKSVFAGREDVFAVRWEKGNKSGYMPAYFYDPYRYRAPSWRGLLARAPKQENKAGITLLILRHKNQRNYLHPIVIL